ncbi:MAG: sugar phosphate isomerase/epimerase [Pirellulaceae bacterium]|nr:sugar phosphate isomerase/epimerase [Pirellulaceae bacterium]
MKSLSLGDALKICAEVGYDCVELPTMADWPGAPEKLTLDDRKKFRDSLAENSLRLSALMENLVLLATPDVHAKNLERLRAAVALGQDLKPEGRTIIETVMGGQPSQWESVRAAMVDRLSEWAAIAQQTNSTIAIKAHISGAAHRPEQLRWLLEQVNSPSLKAAFDFSHFQLRGLDLKESWAVLASDTVFIHVKDSTGDQQKFQFVLPGEGSIDYVEYLKLIRNSGYKGDILVEVSGQIHNRPDYDPIAACKKSYTIGSSFEKVGLKRN